MGGMAKDGHAFNLLKLTKGIACELLLMLKDLFHAEGRDVIESNSQCMGGNIIGGACFKLIGQSVISGLFKAYVLNHFATALIWRQAVEPVFLSIEHTHTCGAIDFVSGESKEVAVESLYIDWHVGHTLSTINEDRHIVLMSYAHNLANRVDGAQHVADVSAANEFGLVREQLLIRIKVECTQICHGYDSKDGSLSLAHHLPRDNVAMMLHRTDDDFIISMNESFSKSESEEVDAFCGTSREENLGRGTSIDKGSYSFSTGLMQFGGLLGKEMHASVDIGIDIIIFIDHRLNHLFGLLGCGTIVEINERMVIDLSTEDGKIFTDILERVHELMILRAYRSHKTHKTYKTYRLLLFAKAAVFALVEFAPESFLHFDIEFLAEGFVLDGVNDLAHKGILE